MLATDFAPGTKVHVEGRFNRLIIDSVRGSHVLARFESGFGFVNLPVYEFSLGWK